MAQTFPNPVVQRLQASGGLAPVSLLEVQTLDGTRYFWSDATISAPSILSAAYPSTDPIAPITFASMPADLVFTPVAALVYPVVNFLPWILTPPTFSTFGSTETSTGTVEIQNLSGDTIRRDSAQIMSKKELIGALVSFRVWQPETEFALFSFVGNVDDADIDQDGPSMTLTLEGLCTWAKIKAPDCQIGVSCGLSFGSMACGSVAVNPCNNDYGSCTSPNRFKGVLDEWVGAALDYSQDVQPVPLVLYNGRLTS